MSTTILKPGSAVLVDDPNLVLSGRFHGQKPRRINYQILGDTVITNEVPGTRLELIGVYANARARSQQVCGWIERTALTLGYAGFSFFPRYGRNKDIDGMIREDICLSVAQHEQSSIVNGRLWYPLQMRIILVSGDSDYLATFRKLKRIYGDHLELEVVVYAWRDGFSRELKAFATRAYYLDDIPGLVEDEKT